MALFGWSSSWNGPLFNFFLALGFSLLFLDLATLINDNSCTLEMDPECPDVYFAQDYFAARQKFRDAAKASGASLESHVIHRENDVDYTMDVAYIKGAEKDGELLVHVSGVSGVEGYAGSAVQVKWLQTYAARDRKKQPRINCSVLLLHAVNPYGMAFLRRFNEHNVELNRNFLLTPEEWAEVLERDPNIAFYEDFDPVLNPNYTVPSLWNRYELLVQAFYYIVLYGYSNLKRAFLTGQYHKPDGIMYGGSKLEPSLVTLRSVIERFRGARRVVVIDVHVGLGRQGMQALMVRDDDDLEKGREVFGNETIDVQARETGVSVGFKLIRGNIHYARMFDTKAIVEVMQDLGTLPSILVGRSTVLEHSAYRSCRGTHAHAIVASWLRDAVYVQKLTWKIGRAHV